VKGDDNVCDDKGPSTGPPVLWQAIRRWWSSSDAKYPDSSSPLPCCDVPTPVARALHPPSHFTATKTRTYYLCLAKSRGGERCR
jgi:hypothetical protein